MRKLYLIRHAHPDFPLGAHVCLGVTDTPLGALGRMQACLLGEALKDAGIGAVFSSPLTRCRETAAPLGREPILVPALAEQNMGPWDGLDFTQIRETWPELYARRASEPLLVPPGAETLAEVQARALPALTACLEQSEGDIALVAHASVVQAILAAVTGTPLEESRPLRPPYTGYAVLDYDGALHLVCRDRLPAAPLTPELAGRLLAAAGPGVRIEAHCRAVAADALRIAEALPLSLDRELLVSAALLHDVARREREHAKLGAAWLQELGYPRAAALVARHHDLQNDTLDETALLFLADKCVREDRRVRLEDRFSESAKRYTTPEALAAHAGRLAAAQAIRNKVNLLAGRRVVD